MLDYLGWKMAGDVVVFQLSETFEGSVGEWHYVLCVLSM